ncbi:MAG: beta-propeller fold lactonase family protein [Proteobacteria bacterium]|nr:beta-propeller fold lactonase family protein [Pseudomonadota bacterium]
MRRRWKPAACHDDKPWRNNPERNDPIPTPPIVEEPQRFTVGGTVTGLTGSGLLLQNNGGDDQGIGATETRFTFGAQLASGSDYAVTVKAQPSGQTCTVNDGSGKVGSVAIGNVKIVCSDITYTVGGTVRSLIGGTVRLSNNAGAALAVGNGQFKFPDQVAAGAAYAVTVAGVDLAPGAPQQTCSVSHGAGVVGTSDVSNIDVLCSVESFKVKGSVAGLVSAGLVLQNNAGDDLPVSADGSFEFATPVASASAYAVTVKSQPRLPTQICTVANGTGVVAGSDVIGVLVTCVRDSATFALIGVGGAPPVVQPHAIGAGGAVDALAAPSGTTSGVPAAIDVNAASRTVNVADGVTIRQFAIATPASNGLTVANSITTANGQLVALRTDPSGRLLVSASATGVVQTYLLNQAGLPIAPVPADSLALSPVTSISFDPTGRFVYFTHGAANYVSAYAAKPDGHLQLVGTEPAYGAYSPAVSGAMRPNGQHFYTASPGVGYTSMYRVDANSGALSRGSIYTAIKSGHMAISPDARFLYVSNQNSPSTPVISWFELNQYGGMMIRGSIALQGAAVADLKFEVDPSNLFLYALSGDRIETYAIDQATGALAFGTSTPISQGGTLALSTAK